MHLQITEQTDAGMLKELAKSLTKVLGEVRAAVEDWRPMRGRIADVIAELDSTLQTASVPEDEIEESAAFLRWLDDNNFTFLGYRDYAFKGSTRNRPCRLSRDRVSAFCVTTR